MKIALVALLLGCGPEILPGQRDAERLVWVETYGRTDQAPLIIWIDADGCHALGGVMHRGQCVGGWCELAPEVTYVVEQAHFHRSGMAHELQHKKQRRLGLAPDYAHARPEWGPRGEVVIANERLAAQSVR